MPILRRDLLKRTAAGAVGFTLSDFAQSRTEIDVEEFAYDVGVCNDNVLRLPGHVTSSVTVRPDN